MSGSNTDPTNDRETAYARFLRYVRDLTDYERERRPVARTPPWSLETMQRLLALCGHPERDTPFLHIAGSNGKGSVVYCADAILRAAGFRTGLYVSPHLVEIGERIVIEHRPSSAQALGEAFMALEPALSLLEARHGVRPSFFELLTTMAFMRMATTGVDIGVLETGLGGRLDATNVVTPLASAITAIEREHTDILGDSLEAIAAEKAGIVKKAIPVVLGPLPHAAMALIRTRAENLHAPILAPVGAERIEFRDGCTVATLTVPGLELEAVEIGALGTPVATNAAIALALAKTAAEILGRPLSEQAVREGLRHLHLPGRFERVPFDPPLIVDVAHTPGALAMLVRTWQRIYPGLRPVVVFGALRDKQLHAMLEALAPIAHSVIATGCKSPREHAPEAIANAARARGMRATCAPGMEQALTQARAAGALAVLVTGSVYVAGLALQQVRGARSR